MADAPINLVERRLEPVAAVVDLLADLLIQAQAGKLRGLAYVVVRAGNWVGEGWSHEYGHFHNLVAGTAYLHQRMVTEALGWSQSGEQDEPEPVA